jgi:hypothetical protein
VQAAAAEGVAASLLVGLAAGSPAPQLLQMGLVLLMVRLRMAMQQQVLRVMR